MVGAVCSTCGGRSTDAEFCSECGAAMRGVVVAGVEACPVCGEARPGATARYCDNCRYDFQTRTPFSPMPPSPAVLAPAPAPEPAVIEPAAVMRRFDMRASVDLSLRQEDDPMPSDERERIFPLDLADHLVGRRSDREDIHPEIALADPGISRRHLRVLREANGVLRVLDLGSTNGTRLNGVALEANVPVPLREGDALTLGCWTRLVVAAR